MVIRRSQQFKSERISKDLEPSHSFQPRPFSDSKIVSKYEDDAPSEDYSLTQIPLYPESQDELISGEANTSQDSKTSHTAELAPHHAAVPQPQHNSIQKKGIEDDVEPLLSADLESYTSQAEQSTNGMQAKSSNTSPDRPSNDGNQKKKGNLLETVQTKMESAFDTDFSDVKLYENSSSAKELNAIAYTQGNEIHFAPGYSPYSSQGQEYLGHELAHVVQQRNDDVKATHQELGYNINDETRLETEADDAGKKAAAGQKASLNSSEHTSKGNAAVQKKSAPIQLLRETIPSAAMILDVNASADSVLRSLESVASSTLPHQAGDVNWRRMFYPAIEAQIRGKTLGSISHNFRNNTGLDCEWDVNISFYMNNSEPTGRQEDRAITTSQGGSASPSLGSSQSDTQSSQVSAGVSQETPSEGGGKTSASAQVQMGDSSTQGHSQGAGGGMTGGQSQSSQETVRRHSADLCVQIDVSGSAGYSNWDIVNPVKWGAHLAGTSRRSRSFNIGTLTYDKPDF